MGKGTDWESKILESDVREIRRNVAIPTKGEPGRWKGGRIGENGKIQEKSIKYEG